MTIILASVFLQYNYQKTGELVTNQLYLLRYEKDRNHTTHLSSCERIFEGVFQLNERQIKSNFKNEEGV